MKKLLIVLSLLLTFIVPALAAPMVKYEDLKIGDGLQADYGDKVTINYELKLSDGKVIDSSYERGEPFSFTVGKSEVIPGFEQGVRGMAPGGKRHVTIPPHLGYGEHGVPPRIPPNATLYFTIEMLNIDRPKDS